LQPLEGVDIDDAIKAAAVVPVAAAAAPAAAHAAAPAKEEHKEEHKKEDEESGMAGLGALFGLKLHFFLFHIIEFKGSVIVFISERSGC